MNGAESLVRTLVAGGVDTCFANPGTSEMHFVAALDHTEGMRCVLVLFEGIATGAADGYARMADKPAATLLHLGPGLANGLANMHNAGKAFSPMINIVGDHATYHRNFDAPLTSDIAGAAKPFSAWVRTSGNAKSVAADGVAAIAAAGTPPGQVATLILPADTAWSEAEGPALISEPLERKQVSQKCVSDAVRALSSGKPTMLLLGGLALRERGLELAGRIGAKTGAKIMAQTFVGRLDRGAGRVPIERLPYAIDQARATLAGLEHIILVGTRVPVAFFAYPNKPSLLASEGTELLTLARTEDDILDALERLADELGALSVPTQAAQLAPPSLAGGAICDAALSQSLGALIPENAIVVEEALSTGAGFFAATWNSQPHTWLQNMGGSIGLGMPMATGAAIACPTRPVLNLQADGSAMYSIQSLWTQAREGLNITTVLFNNKAYACLRQELANVGAQNVGRKALDMLDLSRPDIDFVGLARAMGVPGAKVTTMEQFNVEVARGLRTSGPYLVEVMI
ncbi:acetolactate synthase large subunit [Phyllobacterium chamaecytisi]|uniref:acetolactate synthase large subunit n=1 Tax=Phyllobacterium chamaecytisi TaxID=2876082 RepID=UPI001CCBD6BE|nr:acetolactate synthase large subunit [Phyllobacterium sp. KW56]MBZ9603081.1 acetolactate synthase large subunit [Phyllobacterium sp. KW56]